jgi:hypothetical protein
MLKAPFELDDDGHQAVVFLFTKLETYDRIKLCLRKHGTHLDQD